MYSVLKLIELAPALAAAERSAFRAALRAATVALPALEGFLFEPTCPGSFNAGDLIWRTCFTDADAARRALDGERWRQEGEALLGNGTQVRRLEQVAWTGGACGGFSPARGVYRVALFCANRAPRAERLECFAAETCAMPQYIRSIRRWQLATPHEATGSRVWTHVWEQEYETLAGLTGAYMMHPYHWAHVDRWFDPEWPEWLVDPVLCHAFCETTAPVIFTRPRAGPPDHQDGE
ncbi:MAG: Dabb family protein [Gammaproteobacteria bacterium]|nr:Dabb family protein [Gammaproteobacteria bacterium]